MSRTIQFQNEYYYHICNRGVDKRKVFYDRWDYTRFLESLREFNQAEPHGGFYEKYLSEKKDGKTGGLAPSEGGEIGDLVASEATKSPVVEILAYCLNPNHYHLLVRQLIDKGISKFMKKIGGGYSAYFNNKYKRSGSLWQGTFNPTEIRSTYGLQYLSVYVNCNAEIHGIAKKEDWIWSSYLDYVGVRKGTLCNKQIVLDEFKDIQEYIDFCEDLIPDIKAAKRELEKYDLE